MSNFDAIIKDLDGCIEQDCLSSINTILYAIAALKAQHVSIEEITPKVKLALGTSKRKHKIDDQAKIRMESTSTLLLNLIMSNRADAVDALCYVLARTKLNRHQKTDLISITIVLDHSN